MLIFFVLFFKAINAHELDYDPVQDCMDTYLKYANNNANVLNAAAACANANASTRECVRRVMAAGYDVYGATANCTPRSRK